MPNEKYKSNVLKAVHEAASGLHRIGLIDAKTMREFQQFEGGSGDYTEDRKKWIPESDVKSIVKEIKKRQKQKA